MNNGIFSKTLVFFIAVLFFAVSIAPVSSLSVKQMSESIRKTINESKYMSMFSGPLYNHDTEEEFHCTYEDFDKQLYDRNSKHFQNHLRNTSSYPPDEAFFDYPAYSNYTELRDVYRDRDKYIDNSRKDDSHILKPQPNFEDGKTLYVGGSGPNNYSKIQDAVDNVSDGDTVYVYNGFYQENVVVNKSINLEGEDRNNTIIEGGREGNIVNISCDWVNVSGFSIQNSGWFDGGIDINSNYNTITDNNISKNWYGISLDYSGGNTITGNNISNNHYGISLYESSNNNTITGNNISNNGIYGISLIDSNNNTITGNIISNNDYGIVLDSSSRNNIIGNSFYNNGLHVYDSYNNIVFNNKVDGKSLVYLEGESNKVIDNDAGQVILIRCDSITVENQEISDTDVSIQLLETNNCFITGNTISNNHDYGIRLWDSSGNTITGNNISKNYYGISLDYSGGNTITGNNISNKYYGISLIDSGGNTITGNNISNKYYGIWLEDSSNNNTITGNNISNNLYGIHLQESSYNMIYECEVTANFYEGILIWYSSKNTISNCTIINHTSSGIFLLEGSNDNIIMDNCRIQQNWRGIQIDSLSTRNHIQNCLITGNNIGVKFLDSTNNIVEKCNITGNNCGVWSGKHNTIRKNNFIKNFDSHARWRTIEDVNFFNRNYWSGHESSLPYHVYGLTYDWFPSAKPYDYSTPCDILQEEIVSSLDWDDSTLMEIQEKVEENHGFRDFVEFELTQQQKFRESIMDQLEGIY